jgi:hypothetical protein
MIHILATFKDEVFLTPEIEETEKGYLIKRGFRGHLQERFNPIRLIEQIEIPDGDVFYLMTCRDPSFDLYRATPYDTGVQTGNPMVKRMINHSKKLASAYSMSLALKDTTRPLFFKHLVKRNRWLNVLHHVTYNQAVDELGFLFGICMIDGGYGKKYMRVEQ